MVVMILSSSMTRVSRVRRIWRGRFVGSRLTPLLIRKTMRRCIMLTGLYRVKFLTSIITASYYSTAGNSKKL